MGKNLRCTFQTFTFLQPCCHSGVKAFRLFLGLPLTAITFIVCVSLYLLAKPSATLKIQSHDMMAHFQKEILWQRDLLNKFSNREYSHTFILIIFIACMDLIKFGNLCPFHKIKQGRIYFFFTGLTFNRE
jgi:hypothetical protein